MLPELTLLSAPQILYHNNIVDLLGYFWEPYGGVGRVRYAPVLMLEFTEQGSLRMFLELGPKLGIGRSIELCVNVCQALLTLHHEIKLMGRHIGVFHGDLKPELVPERFFEDKEKNSYVAKLCDLGSCLRYLHDTPLRLNEVPPGTDGWKSPELSGSPDSHISPLFSDIFAFGMLVAYIILGKDLYRLPEVEEFLMSRYFKSPRFKDLYETSQVSHEHPNMSAAQQWMINNHFELFVECILRAVERLELPKREREIVNSILRQTLVFVPEQRAASFSDLLATLGTDHAKSKHRSPIEPIVNTLEDPSSRLSVHWALVLVTAMATMHHLFHDWLSQHLEKIYNHLIRKENDSTRRSICHIALLRGLLAFLPPNVGSKIVDGATWLTRAAQQGNPDAHVLAYNLLAAQGHEYQLADYATHLLAAARNGSVLARESGILVPNIIGHLDDLKFLSNVEKEFEKNSVWPMHLAAFIRDENDLREMLQIFAEQRWDLQIQSAIGIDQVNGGYLTYSMTSPGTALHWAVQMNNLAAVKALIEAGATPYTFTERRRNAWSVAVGARLLPIIKYFVEFCSCLDMTARSRCTIEALFFGLPEAYLACGGRFIERSWETFQYLFQQNILPREEAYMSTISLGSGDARLLQKLLEEDYDELQDNAMLERLLIHAVTTSEVEAVELLLHRTPLFETTNYAVHVLTCAITSPGATADHIFALLLQHLSPNFDINVRFTSLYAQTERSPLISEIEGHTLLHSAFDYGKVRMAVALLRRGADTSILNIDKTSPGTGMNAFGRLFFANTHHNYLALKDFLGSEYIHEHPSFLVDHAVIFPGSNRNVFHFLTSDEDSRLHDSAIHKTTVLNELLRHLRKTPSFRAKVKDLLNSQTREADGEMGVTPLHNAAASGFADAIGLLVAAGADPLFRVGADPDQGYSGITPLHVVDTRSTEVWKQEWFIREAKLAEGNFPWFEVGAPLAKSWKSQYEKRTWRTVRALKQILMKSSAGRELWERRRIFRSQEGLRVE
ncbi:hypothetical protein S7711_11084 [Stachybotrys chartarum IBT 7711]|uniref:Protein kinase domain-containing protein n=1 Tax=Stachybotrys chartarum (strain CBS 109288 / IBT 7711) TaxID=1280523 RepID=A0A084B788_STACB|nr:hypothetical protein S7711_11084 [Stachybotrys chartarum IBT 7711]